jgi:hypothetical protein
MLAVAVHKMTFSVDRDFVRVTAPTVDRVAQDPCLEHIRKLPASELEALIYCILRHFARWSSGEILQLDACNTLIGNICFVRSVPRFEAACLVYAIRDNVLEIDKMERLRSGSEFEPSGPEDEGAGTRFFDLLVFELLKGY